MTPAPPLLVFADDWGRHPSSCQHLVRRFLPRHPVCWVNTIGTRTPRLDRDTLARGLEKARHWFRKPAGKAPRSQNPTVLSPWMWPWLGSSFSRRLNRSLLVRPLARAIADFAEPPIAITTLPIVADLVGVLPVRRWVYYCVDDFSQWPGLDQAALAALDEELIRKADVLIAVSENLQKRLAERGRPAPILTHGVDLDFWRDPGQAERLEAVANLERPLVVFWGVLDRRMDVGYVRQLSQDLERGTVVLVGPRADPEPALLTLQRVVHLPPLPFEQLPLLAREAQVLIMPYADLPVTRAMQPLKLKEYLATSRPVVVTDLPANREWADCLDIATQPEAFSGAVRQRLASGLPADQRAARRRLGGEGWQEKARLFAHWAFPEGASNGS